LDLLIQASRKFFIFNIQIGSLDLLIQSGRTLRQAGSHRRARQFVGRSVPLHRELANTSDGFRAFDTTDISGYVLCFGRPVDK
jgi:hypothetical protein